MFLELPGLLSPACFQSELTQLEAICEASRCTDLILAGDGSVAQAHSKPDTSAWVVSPEFKSAVEAAVDRVLVDAVVHWDLLWLRAKGRAAGTPKHCDRTYLEKHTTLFGQADCLRQVGTLWCLMRDLAPGQSKLMMDGLGKTSRRVQACAAGDAVLFDADQQHSATVGRSGKLRFSFDVRVTFSNLRA
jgi:hypothetical protein